VRSTASPGSTTPGVVGAAGRLVLGSAAKLAARRRQEALWHVGIAAVIGGIQASR
jgi:hypothetical protein